MSRRIKIIRVTRGLLASMFAHNCGHGPNYVLEGVPDGARIVGISEHLFYDQDEIAFKVESDTFDEVADGQAIHVLVVTARRITLQPKPVLCDAIYVGAGLPVIGEPYPVDDPQPEIVEKQP